MSKHLNLTKFGAIATVTLTRPDVRNAFDALLIKELTECFLKLEDDDSVRIIILTGSGKAFCAGADLNWMKASASYSAEENRIDAKAMATMFRTIDSVSKFLIVRVNGHALGGGLGLICCGDATFGISRAKFGFTEVRLGIVPAVISPFCIRRIGIRWGRRLFASGEIFDGDFAEKVGLLDTCYDSLSLMDEAITALSKEVILAGPLAVSEAKALAPAIAVRDLKEGVDFATAMIARLRLTVEGQEGFSAFLDKRKPKWIEGNS